jgi:cellulose synthase/poly-beta-1,6-N-acetylglucosamine synthase-like glycosyltransferase
MELIIRVYLALMFVAVYMFIFFVILLIKNKKFLFYSPPTKNYPSVSFLVPAYNEEDSIASTIDHLLDMDYPKDKIQIIVINDGSKDGTKKVIEKYVSKYSRVILLDKLNSGKADSLNQGIKLANGVLIAVVDSDSFPSKGSLKKIVGYFNDQKMSAVTSFVSARNSEHNYLAKIQTIEYLFMGWTRKLLDFLDSVYVTNGPLSVYRKEYVKKVGGFDPKSITEDIDITWNLLSHNYKTSMCLDARVSTIVPTTFKQWFRQRTRWGLGGLQAIYKYRAIFFKKGMFGAFVLPFVSFSIFLSLFGFFFSFYLILKQVFSSVFTMYYSFSLDASLFHFNSFNYYPSVLIFYLTILFICSMVYYRYILVKTEYMKNLSFKVFSRILFYTLLYLMIYPVIWIVSIYRYIKKDQKW